MRIVILLMLLAMSPLLIDRALDLAPSAVGAAREKADEASTSFSYGSMPSLTVGRPVRLVPEPASDADTYFLHGTMPPGLALGRDGSITGTPLKSGTYSFRTVATRGKASAFEDLRIVIRDRLAVRLPSEVVLTHGRQGARDSQPVIVEGGDGVYDVSLYEAPDWLSIDGEGRLRLAGEAPPEDTLTVGVNAEDGEGRTANAVLRVRIVPPPPPAPPDEAAGTPSPTIQTPWGVIPRQEPTSPGGEGAIPDDESFP